MISKKVAMKAAEKSRFGKLVAYLLDPQGKKTRVGEVSITNCVSTDMTWAVREITATQRLNARAISDRTYHLLVSLRAGENPDAQTLREIEQLAPKNAFVALTSIDNNNPTIVGGFRFNGSQEEAERIIGKWRSMLMGQNASLKREKVQYQSHEIEVAKATPFSVATAYNLSLIHI